MLVDPATRGRVGEVADLDPAPVELDEVVPGLNAAFRENAAEQGVHQLLAEVSEGMPVRRE